MFDLYRSEHEKVLQDRLISPVEENLDLKRWEFTLNYKNHTNGYVAIYNSPLCRLRFSLSLDTREKNDTIGIRYGRSHAPNDQDYLIFQDENGLAWHHFQTGYIGQFLDGVSPRQLARARIERAKTPSQAEKDFEQNTISKGLRSPIWGLQLERFAWEYYDEKLFLLFDVQHTQKWLSYRHFLLEYYNELVTDATWNEIISERPKWKPLPWQVC